MICTRMAIFGTFWPFLLLEPFGLYLSVLNVERMHLFHPFEKIVKVLLPEKGPKIEKMAILSVMLAILGHFLRFSPDDHLDTCFSDQQDFTESTLMLYILRYSYFKAQYPEKQGKWPLYAPEWPYLVLFGHFFCWNLSASI